MALHRADHVADEIERAALRFDIEPAEIFADHAEHEHLDRAEEHDDQHRRGPALHGVAEEEAIGDVQHQQHGRAGQREAGMAGEA